MSDQLRFSVDTGELARAVRALDQVAGASGKAEAAATELAAATRKVGQATSASTAAVAQSTQATGRLATSSTQAAQAAQRQGRALAEMGDSARQAASALSGVRGVVAGFLSAETVRRALLMADAYQTIGERLKVVSESTAVAAARQAQLVALAIQTRTPLDAVATTYQRIAAVSSELGVTQAQVLTVTKAIAQSLRVAGATQQEASASSQQLAQALGKGVLAGDELGSILENNLTLAQAIAAGFGVSVGKLREMGSAGQLTSRDVFAAIERQAGSIAAQFGKVGPTLGSGLETFKTGLTAAIGQLDTMLGLTKGIGLALTSAGETLASPTFANGLFTFVKTMQLGLAVLAKRPDVGLEAIKDLAGGREAFESREAIRQQRVVDARDALGRVLVNPLSRLDGRAVSSAGFGIAGLGSGLPTLQAAGIGVSRGFDIGAPADPDALARAFRDAAANTKDRLGKLTERITKLGSEAERLLAVALDPVEEAQRRRIRAGLETGDPLADAQRAQLEAGIRRELNAQALAFGRRDLSGGPSGIVDMTLVRAEKLREEAAARAQEMRKLFTEQLARGVQDGLAQPIAQFLRTWQLNVKTLGDALRDALINAVSAALANAATKKLLELFDRIKPAASSTTDKLGLATQLAASFATGRGGMVGGFGGLPIPGLRLPFGGGGAGGATDALSNAAKGGSLKSGAAATAGKSLSLGGGLVAGGIGLGVGGALGRARGTGAGVLGGAASGALAGALVGGPVGAIVGGLAGVVGGLLGGSARRRAQRAEAEARRESSRSLLEDLRIRNAAAGGDDATAERLRLEAQQRRELAEIIKQFGAQSREVAALRNTQAAELRALTDSALGPGVYLGPSGFDPARARFDAGRPTAPTITGNTFNIAVPEGTTQEQARAILDEFSRMAADQGLPASDWSRIQVS